MRIAQQAQINNGLLCHGRIGCDNSDFSGSTNRRRPYRRYDALSSASLPIRREPSGAEIEASMRASGPTLDGSSTYSELVEGAVLPLADESRYGRLTSELYNRLHIEPFIGHLRLQEITFRHVLWILRKLRDDGYAVATRNRILTEIRRIFKLAQRLGIVGADLDPTRGIPLLEETGRERYLSEDEVELLHRALSTERTIIAQIIWLLLLTGARRSEVTHLLREDLHLEAGYIKVPIAKNGEKRTITLNSAAVGILRSVEAVPGNPYVFPWPRTGKPIKTLHYYWDGVRRRAGLQEVRLHDLRHSFASFCVRGNVSLYIVQKLLGHASISTTERYAHLDQRTLRRATDHALKFVNGACEAQGQHQVCKGDELFEIKPDRSLPSPDCLPSFGV